MKHCEIVCVKAATEALNLMKIKKAAGQSGTTTKLLKECENGSVKKKWQWWLTTY